MVINSYGKSLLGSILTYNIIIQKSLYLFWLLQVKTAILALHILQRNGGVIAQAQIQFAGHNGIVARHKGLSRVIVGAVVFPADGQLGGKGKLVVVPGQVCVGLAHPNGFRRGGRLQRGKRQDSGQQDGDDFSP
jgi:hypothetical protein